MRCKRTDDSIRPAMRPDRSEVLDHTAHATGSYSIWPGVALIAAATLAVLMPGVLGSDPLYGFDSLQETFFWQAWIHARLGHGAWPVWCAGLAGGLPLVAEPVVQFWYLPAALLHAVFAPGRAINLTWEIHLVWAGAGMLLLLRDRGLSAGAGMVGGLAYAVGGWMLGHLPMGGLPHLATCSWTPWIFRQCLLLGDDARGPAPRDMACAAIAVGAGVLAGHEQFQYSTLAGLAVFVALSGSSPAERTALRQSSPPSRRADFARLGLAVALGLGLACVVAVPYAELVGASNRGASLPGEFGMFGARLLPAQLLAILAPTFFGDGVGTPYWGFPTRESVTLFLGIVPLALALSPALPRARRETWALRALAILALVLALGPATHLYGFFERWLPLFGRARHPARWLHLAAFAGAWLAAWGAEGVLQRLSSRVRPRSVTPIRSVLAGAASLSGFGVVIAVAVVAWLWFAPATGGDPRFSRLVSSTVEESALPAGHPLRHAEPHALAQAAARARGALLQSIAVALVATLLLSTARAAGASAMGTPILVGLTLLDLVGLSRRFVFTFSADSLAMPPAVEEALGPADPEFRIASMVPGSAFPFPPPLQGEHAILSAVGQLDMHRVLLDGRASAQAGVPTTPRDWLRLALGGKAYDFNYAAVGPRPILDLLAARHLLTGVGVRPDGPGWTRVATGDAEWTWRNERALPRATLVHACSSAPSRATALAMLRSPAAQPARRAWVIGECPAGIEPAPSDAGQAEKIDWLTATDERVELQVVAATGALLRLADNDFPGWSARVDDRDVPTLRVDVALRGVVIPRGTHRVEFRYRPSAPWVGIVLSLATWTVVLILGTLPGFGGPGLARPAQRWMTSIKRRQRSSSRPGTNGQ